jgi:hypothetical protein
MRQISTKQYAVCAFSVFIAGFALLWVWTIFGRMWFLDPLYPMWTYKVQMMRDRCYPEDTVIIGDSRAMVGLLPDAFGPDIHNLALGGGSPVEIYYGIKKMEHCATLPRHMFLSIAPFHLVHNDMYWNVASWGFLSLTEMEEVRRNAENLADESVYHPIPVVGGLANQAANWLHALSFPYYYLPSLQMAGFVGRHGKNLTVYHTIRDQNGQYFFGDKDGSDVPGPEATSGPFRPSPLLDHYYNLTLDQLRDHGVRIDYVAMPISDLTAMNLPAGYREAYEAYMTNLLARYPNVRIIGDLLPVLPADYFGDNGHLNSRGATMWSQRVAAASNLQASLSR